MGLEGKDNLENNGMVEINKEVGESGFARKTMNLMFGCVQIFEILNNMPKRAV